MHTFGKGNKKGENMYQQDEVCQEILNAFACTMNTQTLKLMQNLKYKMNIKIALPSLLKEEGLSTSFF